MNNYLRDTINQNNRRQYMNTKSREEDKNIYYYGDDQGTIEAFKLLAAIVGAGVIIVGGCFFIKNKTKDSDKTNSDTTRVQAIEEVNDSNNISTAVVMNDGNATIYNLDSYSTANNDDTYVLTTIDGEQFVFDRDDVIILTGDDSYNNAYVLAENMIDEDGEINTYEKNNNQTKKLVLTKNTMTR